jgi:alpha-tubulin suppressor-like RCC1 family protein
MKTQKLSLPPITNIRSEIKAIAIADTGSLYLWNGLDVIPQRDIIKELRKEHFVDAVASYKFFALTDKGDLYEWNQAPVVSEAFKDRKLAKIIPGNSFMFGIDINGAVYGYGWNQYGLLGLGEESRSKRQVNTPELVKTLEDLQVSSLACGLNHNLLIANVNDVEEQDTWVSGREQSSV